MNERVLLFGAAARLVGVFSRPERLNPTAPVFVIMNAGLIHRVGPNRLHVDLARALAKAGFATLRFDLSNTGDSSPRNDALPFDAAAVAETREAVSLALEAAGTRNAILCGLCSGAMVSVKTALADDRIQGAVLVNTQSYRVEGDLKRILDLKKESRYFWSVSFFNPRSWGRFLTGRSNYLANLRMLFGQAKGAVARQDTANAVAGWDLAKDFNSLGTRGFPALLAFSEHDPALDAFKAVARAAGPDAMQSFTIESFPGADHTFTPRPARARLVERVVRFATELAGNQKTDSATAVGASEST